MHAQSSSPLARDVDDYLVSKRRRLTDSSYEGYSSTLWHLAAAFPDAQLADFEMPHGTRLVEGFLNSRWAGKAPRTFNKNLTIVRDFFQWQARRGGLRGDPTLPIERAKVRQVHRTTFTEWQCATILAANLDDRDQIALRLLLHYGIRKGALQTIQFEQFDPDRRRVEIFTKGEKIQRVPITEQAVWDALERLLLAGAQPRHYLLPRRRVSTKRADAARRFAEFDAELAKLDEVAASFRDDLVADLVAEIGRVRHRVRLENLPDVRVIRCDDTRPLGEHGLHHWWYRCLERAGIVDRNVSRGQRMHKARHTAGQRVLDKTENLKAVQSLLGHATIGTTGDIYTEWGEDRLEVTMGQVLPSG